MLVVQLDDAKALAAAAERADLARQKRILRAASARASGKNGPKPSSLSFSALKRSLSQRSVLKSQTSGSVLDLKRQPSGADRGASASGRKPALPEALTDCQDGTVAVAGTGISHLEGVGEDAASRAGLAHEGRSGVGLPVSRTGSSGPLGAGDSTGLTGASCNMGRKDILSFTPMTLVFKDIR